MVKGSVWIWVFVLGFVFTAYAQENTCISCHQQLDEEHARTPVEKMAQDVHAKHGLSCADCHGGDPSAEDIDESMDPDKGFVGTPGRDEIPEFCGKCHQDAVYMRKFNPTLRVDQLELYWTSVHGQKLRNGDEKVATCVDCHNTHGILPSSDARSPVYATRVPQTCARCHSDAEYMAGYGIPTNQFEKYKKSVHGALLLVKGGRGAPACNDCHGNHGAAPPGVSSVANVCGQCHSVNAELLRQSPHARVFEAQGIPACESCHGHHEVLHPTHEMLGTGEGAVCLKCHKEDSPGYVTAAAMKAEMERLQGRHDRADELLSRAEQAGMEVRESRFELHEVANYITRAKAVQHASSLAKVEAVVAEGDSLVAGTIAQAGAALDELQFRRRGLGVSLIFILVLGLALFLKIRDVDRNTGMK